jgi:triosephosphate isomerase
MLIVGNWKAYVQSTDHAKKLYAGAKRLASSTALRDTQIVLAVPAPYLGLLSSAGSKSGSRVGTGRSKVGLAAQDLSIAIGGAATGEVTGALLRDLGVTHALIGHSERRAMGETDEMVSEKVRHAHANKIIPIVCVGERQRDPDAKYLKLLRAQIDAVFSPLSPKERAQTILAYEPIWAIGKTAADALTPGDLNEMVLYIRKILGAYLPGRGAQKVKLLYGGSVEPANIRSLAEGTGIDGFLPGHASADEKTFAALVKALQ